MSRCGAVAIQPVPRSPPRDGREGLTARVMPGSGQVSGPDRCRGCLTLPHRGASTPLPGADAFEPVSGGAGFQASLILPGVRISQARSRCRRRSIRTRRYLNQGSPEDQTSAPEITPGVENCFRPGERTGSPVCSPDLLPGPGPVNHSLPLTYHAGEV